MVMSFNQLIEHNLPQLNAVFPLDQDELNLFKNAGMFSKKTIRNHHRLSDRVESRINDYEALSYHCQTGSNPLWISPSTSFKPEKILYNLFIDDYELFLQFIQSLKPDACVMERLEKLITITDFFCLYNRFNLSDKLLKHFLAFLKPIDFQILVEGWLNQLISAEVPLKDTAFENWLIKICEGQSKVSLSVSLILKDIIEKVSGKKNEKVLLVSLTAISNRLLVQNRPIKTKEKVKLLKNKVPTRSTTINNAGLVLLWPFFKNLFSHLEWLNENNFKDNLTRQKAVVYLHYLVYDQLPKDESQLLLNKIICSVKPEEVIDISSINFSEKEMAEVNDLKTAVLENWVDLKTSSAQGLTNTFLVRNGNLNKKENDWSLNVEKKGFDVLLGRLPWGLSTIKLPWNNHLIYVSW